MHRKQTSIVLVIFALIAATTISDALRASACIGKPLVLRHVCGIVIDPSGEPSPGAEITISNEQDQPQWKTLATVDGRFKFPKIPAGKYILRVHWKSSLPAAISIIVKRPIDSKQCDNFLQIKMPLDYCPTVSIEKAK